MCYEPKGFKALASLERSQIKKEAAHRLRAYASIWSTEYDWVNKMYKTADRIEFDADCEDRE